MYSPGCPGTHSAEQAGFKLNTDSPASASQVLRIKVCAQFIQHFQVDGNVDFFLLPLLLCMNTQYNMASAGLGRFQKLLEILS